MDKTIYYFVDAVETTKPLLKNLNFWVAIGTVGAAIATAFAFIAATWNAIEARKMAKLLEKEFLLVSRPFLGFTKMHNTTTAGLYIDLKNCGKVPTKHRTPQLTINGRAITPLNQSTTVTFPDQITNFFLGDQLRQGDVVTIVVEYCAVSDTDYQYQISRTFKIRGITAETAADDEAN